MVSLHYLKYMHNLSDEGVLDGWVENPYWQYLSGMKFFQHVFPIDPPSMTRWRGRIGEAGAEELLKETIDAGLKLLRVRLQGERCGDRAGDMPPVSFYEVVNRGARTRLSYLNRSGAYQN